MNRRNFIVLLLLVMLLSACGQQTRVPTIRVGITLYQQDDTFLTTLSHVLKGIVQVHILGDGHAVVGDEGRAVLPIQNHVAALGTQGDLYGICQGIDAGFQSFAGLIAALNELRHNQ